MGGLTALDIVVLLAVGGGMVLGVLRGFVAEILSLVSWVAIIAVLKLLHGPLSEALSGVVGTRGGAAVLAFALIFLSIYIGGRVLANRFGQAARGSMIAPVDRILGGGFGALKGLIGVTLFYLLANLVYDTAFGRAAERPDWMAQSRTYPLLNASGRAIVDFVEARRNAGQVAPDGNAQSGDGQDER